MKEAFDPRVTKPTENWHRLMCCLHLLYESRSRSRVQKFRKQLHEHRFLFRELHKQGGLDSPAFTIARNCLLDLFVNPQMNNDEGRKFLSFVACELDDEFLHKVVDMFVRVALKRKRPKSTRRDEDTSEDDMQITGYRNSSEIMNYMSDMLFRLHICIYESGNEELLAAYEKRISDLYHDMLRSVESNYQVYRELLYELSHSKRSCVRDFLHDNLLDETMDCIHSANYCIRTNGYRLFYDMFPLIYDFDDNMKVFIEGVNDRNASVRATNIVILGILMYNYYEQIVKASVNYEVLLFDLVKRMAKDVSSPKVRVAVIKYLLYVIQSPFAQVQVVIPHLMFLLHDVNSETRETMAKLIASTAFLSNSKGISEAMSDHLLARVQKDSLICQITGSPGASRVLSKLLVSSLFDSPELTARLDKVIQLTIRYPTILPHILHHAGFSDVDKLKLSATLFLYSYRHLEVHENRLNEIKLADWLAELKNESYKEAVQASVIISSSYALLKTVNITQWSPDLLDFTLSKFDPRLISFAIKVAYGNTASISPVMPLIEITLQIAIHLHGLITCPKSREKFAKTWYPKLLHNITSSDSMILWLLQFKLACIFAEDEQDVVGVLNQWISIMEGVHKSFWGSSDIPLGDEEMTLVARFLKLTLHLAADDFPISTSAKDDFLSKLLFNFLNQLEAVVDQTSLRQDTEYTQRIIVPHFVDLLTISISVYVSNKKLNLCDIYHVISSALARVRKDSPVCAHLCHVMIEALSVMCSRSKVYFTSLQSLRHAITSWAHKLEPDSRKSFVESCQRCLIDHLKTESVPKNELEDAILVYIDAYLNSIDYEETSKNITFLSLGVCQYTETQTARGNKRTRFANSTETSGSITSVIKCKDIDPELWRSFTKFLDVIASHMDDAWVDKMLLIGETRGHELMTHTFYALKHLRNIENADLVLNQAQAAEEDQSEIVKILESATGQTPIKQLR